MVFTGTIKHPNNLNEYTAQAIKWLSLMRGKYSFNIVIKERRYIDDTQSIDVLAKY